MLSTSPVPPRHVAGIRGIVEVTRSMRDTDTEERLRIATVCKDVLLTQQGLARVEPGLIGMVEKLGQSYTGAQEVVIVATHVQVFHEHHLISSQMIGSISVLAALKDTNGLLVIIGKCQKRDKRVAVVLDMFSDKKADQVIDDYQKVKEAMNNSRITAPLGVVKPLPARLPKDFPASLTEQQKPSPKIGTPLVGLDKIEPSKPPSSFKPDVKNAEILAGRHTAQPPPPRLPSRPPPKPMISSPSTPSLEISTDVAPPKLPTRSQMTDRSSRSSSPPPDAKKRGPRDPLPQIPMKNTPTLPPRRPTGVMTNVNNIHTPEESREVSVSSSSTNTSSCPEETYYSDPDTEASSIYGTINSRIFESCYISMNTTENTYYSEPDTENSAIYGQSNHPATTNSSQDKKFSFNIHANSNESATGSFDFQSESNQTEDDTPVLLSFRHRETVSLSPLAGNMSRFSTASDSSCSDAYEEPDYVAQETFYTSLGISVEDSERIYMNKSIRQIKKPSKSSTSREEINRFLLEDNNHIEKLSRINMAREDMQYQLQNHLRGTQALCKVHQDIHEELKECGDSYTKISKVLIKYKEQFESHIYYVKKATEINNNLSTLSNDLLKKYPGIKEDIRCSWKILNFYLLNLESFQKKAPEEDKPALTEAIEMLRDLSRQADTEVLLDGVKGAPYPLHSLGSLLLHSSFQVTGPLLKRDLSIRVLLFPKTIVITQHKNNKYEFLLDLPIMQSYFGPLKQEQSKSFSIEVNYGGIQGKKTYTFTATTKDVKEVWVSEIAQLMGQFAEEEKKIQNKRNAIQT